jgi:7,8-dihydro-6-hydroxymethylpterin-pyrophosphokinase
VVVRSCGVVILLVNDEITKSLKQTQIMPRMNERSFVLEPKKRLIVSYTRSKWKMTLGKRYILMGLDNSPNIYASSPLEFL